MDVVDVFAYLFEVLAAIFFFERTIVCVQIWLHLFTNWLSCLNSAGISSIGIKFQSIDVASKSSVCLTKTQCYYGLLITSAKG